MGAPPKSPPPVKKHEICSDTISPSPIAVVHQHVHDGLAGIALGRAAAQEGLFERVVEGRRGVLHAGGSERCSDCCFLKLY